MDAPPLISPSAGPARNAGDEKLLKRAGHAGRNLSILAILATLGSVAGIAAAILVKGLNGMLAILAVAITLIAIGYWMLALAARRGNPNSVGIVIVMLVLQICLSLISAGVVAARAHTSYQAPLGGLIIPVLVVASLASSRNVLLELKKRQLWDQVFGSARPSGHLCIIGGAILAAGFLALNAGSVLIGWNAGQQRKAEIQRANAFVELLRGDEKEFLTAMKGISTNGEQTTMALAKFDLLEQNLEALKQQSADNDKLSQILNTYGNALRQWKNGLTLMSGPDADPERAQKMFKLGDQLRTEACQEFDLRYAGKKPQSSE